MHFRVITIINLKKMTTRGAREPNLEKQQRVASSHGLGFYPKQKDFESIVSVFQNTNFKFCLT